MKLQALMGNSGGVWKVFVPLLGSVSNWPEHRWPHGVPIPTPAARREVLADLGYEPLPGAAWRWEECPAASAEPDDPHAPVDLIAAIELRERGGEVAA
ncbi:DUF6303 family protein [Streptomyces sp. ST2-7A]|uniref:DUF6303 family protein n=1 Tax=Streptomyces sp. ST2-7A TaxID=2907214 RepID=UPI001F2F4EE8|nr:DUF6303 family protein [Streptomyces sp. ST2-7A]MCE7080445.1 DUF6303 family protein [Streptomyces sp. ST2-7A]